MAAPVKSAFPSRMSSTSCLASRRPWPMAQSPAKNTKLPHEANRGGQLWQVPAFIQVHDSCLSLHLGLAKCVQVLCGLSGVSRVLKDSSPNRAAAKALVWASALAEHPSGQTNQSTLQLARSSRHVQMCRPADLSDCRQATQLGISCHRVARDEPVANKPKPSVGNESGSLLNVP